MYGSSAFLEVSMEFFDKYELRQLNNLELLARQVVEGFIIGLHKSPFHGFSVEFAEHRLYNPGDSTKNVDWKVYARTDKLFVKKYEEETNLRCQILLDVSSSMNFPEATSDRYNELNKLRWAALGAASLMNLLRRQRDAFGLGIYDSEVRTQTGCKSSTSHYRLLLSYIEKYVMNQERGRTSSVAEALHRIADSIHKRSLVMIFSDMFQDGYQQEELFSALQHLKYNKHEVVVFHVVDKSKEIDFEFENRPYELIDLESGEKVRLQAHQIKDKYTEKVKAYVDAVKSKCLQYRIDFVECDIQKGYEQVLHAYLIKRGKMST